MFDWNVFLENVKKKDSVANWKEAVEIAAQPLLEREVITSEYIQSIKDAVLEYGSYMVLGDEFALMHARPGVGVQQVGVSLLILENSVPLIDKPVKIFMVLAATDSVSHLELLSEIMSVFMDEEKFKIIKKGKIEEIGEMLRRE